MMPVREAEEEAEWVKMACLDPRATKQDDGEEVAIHRVSRTGKLLSGPQ